MTRTKIAIWVLIIACLPSSLFAKGAGTSGGLTLLTSYSARSAALGESLTASTNDIAAFGSNPASLSTLKSGQASFLYQKGLIDDSYGHFIIGSPLRRSGSFGFSLGYYSGGSIDLAEENGTERTVTAQTDISLALGYSRHLGPVTVGMTGKYLSSELIESVRAQAFAGDVGMQFPLMPRARMGLALQNYGTELKFIEEGDRLPRVARVGVSYLLKPGKYATTLLLDAPYMVNERELVPAGGVEVMLGLLALRGGYRGGNVKEFTIGTGFLLGSSSLDYSFGLIQNLDSQHKVSFAMKFGSGRAEPYFTQRKNLNPNSNISLATKTTRTVKPLKSAALPRKPPTMLTRKTLGGHKARKTSVVQTSVRRSHRRVYIVREGDSLASIAKKEYGLASQWKSIYSANKHLIESPKEIEVGQKIVLP